MKKPKKNPESNWLTTPIYPYDYEHLISKTALGRVGEKEKDIAEYCRKLMEHASMEQWRRLNKLFSYYKILENDPIKWMKLATSLAEECFDGLKIKLIKPKKGRKSWWDNLKYALLYKQYNEHKSTYPDKSDEAVCGYLSSKQPWKKKNIACKALQNKLSKAKQLGFFSTMPFPELSAYISGIQKLP